MYATPILYLWLEVKLDLINHQFDSSAPNVNQVEILEATHDDCKKEQTILCLINGQEIIVITACIRSEPNIKLRLELGDGPQQYKFVYAKVKDHLLVLVTQNAVICIFSYSPLFCPPVI